MRVVDDSGGGPPLRLMLYDRTCRGRGPLPGLSHAWYAGGHLYEGLGRIDAWYGASNWADALDWLTSVVPDRPIGEIQFWAHGQWGGVRIDEELVEIDALGRAHPLNERLRAVRARLVPKALWWFRCCDVFGTARGHEFARAWANFFDCRAAGHTYVIHFLQSGLHVLEPGATPHWATDEGVAAGRAYARSSHVLAPNTITCLQGRIPEGMR